MKEKIKILELNSGEFLAMGAIEIISIPHISTLKENYEIGTDIELEYQKGFETILSELFYKFKKEQVSNPDVDFEIEILWLTEEVEHQPFKAQLKTYLMIRVIHNQKESCLSSIIELMNSCVSVSSMYKYQNKIVDPSQVEEQVTKIENNDIEALVKEEKIEYLQNQFLPVCYSFDSWKTKIHDLSSIINCLINHPNCAILFEFIPTKYKNHELKKIAEITQMLDTLSKGIEAQGIGSVSYSLADNLTEVYKYYQTNRNAALFTYNILILGPTESKKEIASKLSSFLNFDSSKTIALRSITVKESELSFKKDFLSLPWLSNELLQNSKRNEEIWDSYQEQFQDFYRLPFIITAEEASNFFRLPIANAKISAGLNVNETKSTSKTYAKNLINSGDIILGKLKTSNNEIGIERKDLAKHMLVVGTPGSGKTTFSVGLLDRLWKDHQIPFLVIEPAKNEYRALVQSIPNLQVFTPGKNFISPFFFNPFVPPKNVKLETYKSTLKTAFAAGVSMTSPLDKIFEESINNCYSDFRWLDSYTTDNSGKIFNISDFIKCFEETFEEIGYTGDAKNIGRAGVVRLNSLMNLFDNYFSIPIEDILKKPTIIELAAIENSDQKALIISLLLLSILSYVNANYVGEGGLKNVILLEEAHVLLDSESNSGEGEANPSGIAKGLIKRMLAEIRSYGVGLIIADQSPRKVSTDVVALTDMKVVFRLVEASDKQIIADSMNLSEASKERLSRLKPGEAYLFFNRLDEPEEIVTPDYRLENKISISLSDESIKELSTYWKDKQEKLRPYPECEKVKYCNHTCDYNQRILAREVARQIYKKNFKPNTTDFESLKNVFANISKLIKEELNEEPFTKELLACVKVHLWRKIRYGTKIPITETQVNNSLDKA